MKTVQFATSRSRLAAVLVTFLALVGCNVSPMENPSNTSSAPIAGLLEVRIEGIGDASASAVATFTAAPGNSSVNTRALTALPDSILTLVRREVSFHDLGNPGDAGATRYSQASFEISNTGTKNFNNLNFIAINLPSKSIGSTAISAIVNGRGEAITDDTTAQAFMPTHGMQTTRSGLGVNPYTADLQFFTQPEADTVQTQAALLSPALVGNVLQYGFVAHNNSGGRAIEALGCSSAPDCNKGVISLAYKLPLVSPRAANPWGFTAYFVVTDQTETFVSQSFEEQNQCTVLGQAQFLPLTTTLPKVRTLQGSSYHGANLERLAGVRTAGTSAAPLASLPLFPAKLAGSLDNTCFASGGQVMTAVGTGLDRANTLTLTPDGKSIVAGYTNNGTQDLLLVARYNPNGTLDSSFGTGGKTTTDFSQSIPGGAILLNAQGTAVALQTDGKIVVAGTVRPDLPRFSRTALVRYNTDGSLDSSFGTAGKVFVELTGSRFDTLYQATALQVQPDGKILVAGQNEVNEGRLARFTSDGVLDSGFDTDGFVAVRIVIGALELQSDSKIVIAGSFNNGLLVVRLLSNGALDPNFRGSIFPVVGGNPILKALKIQTDGKIILAGASISPSAFFSMRITADGRSLDRGFGNNGTILTDISVGRDQINTLGIEPDGTLVVAGFSSNNIALARYTTAGILDSSFGNNGIATTTIGTQAAQATALGIRPDGKIVVAGFASNGNNDDLALLQYNP